MSIILTTEKGIKIKRQPYFKKRHFNNPGEVLKESFQLLRARSKIITLMRTKSISPEFRERLMLAVTEVNRCRYCSFAHTGFALQSGLNSNEIRLILKHEIKDCPAEQIPAILYAQHWAETDGHPDSELRKGLIIHYGAPKAEMIELVLHLIRMGNLIGNSFDYLLFRISFGLLGN
jgi:AhpD family alkylhydroperoxidase